MRNLTISCNSACPLTDDNLDILRKEHLATSSFGTNVLAAWGVKLDLFAFKTNQSPFNMLVVDIGV